MSISLSEKTPTMARHMSTILAGHLPPIWDTLTFLFIKPLGWKKQCFGTVSFRYVRILGSVSLWYVSVNNGSDSKLGKKRPRGSRFDLNSLRKNFWTRIFCRTKTNCYIPSCPLRWKEVGGGAIVFFYVLPYCAWFSASIPGPLILETSDTDTRHYYFFKMSSSNRIFKSREDRNLAIFGIKRKISY